MIEVRDALRKPELFGMVTDIQQDDFSERQNAPRYRQAVPRPATSMCSIA